MAKRITFTPTIIDALDKGALADPQPPDLAIEPGRSAGAFAAALPAKKSLPLCSWDCSPACPLLMLVNGQEG